MVAEQRYDTDIKRLHTFQVPSVGEQGFYRTALSLHYFQYGKRARRTPQDVSRLRYHCSWGPDALYHVYRELDWRERMDSSTSMYSAAMQRKEYEGGANTQSVDEIPRTTHASLYAFFEHIGFDRHKRFYPDKDGKPRNPPQKYDKDSLT